MSLKLSASSLGGGRLKELQLRKNGVCGSVLNLKKKQMSMQLRGNAGNVEKSLLERQQDRSRFRILRFCVGQD